MTKQTGFTIIELLVVISVISLISSVILTAVGSAREKAKDSKRLAEKNEVIKAMQFYFDDHGTFPPTPTTNYWACVAPSSESCYLGTLNGDDSLVTALTPYLPVLPTNNVPIGTWPHNRMTYKANAAAGNVCPQCPAGAYLMWVQQGTITSSECVGLRGYSVPFWYCIEHLGR